MYFADKAPGSREGALNIEGSPCTSVADGRPGWANF